MTTPNWLFDLTQVETKEKSRGTCRSDKSTEDVWRNTGETGGQVEEARGGRGAWDGHPAERLE